MLLVLYIFIAILLFDILVASLLYHKKERPYTLHPQIFISSIEMDLLLRALARRALHAEQ